MSLLRDRRFALLVSGQAINAIGSWCALVALWGYASYRFDAGPAQIALLSLSWSLPAAVFGPLGGLPVDRFGPRTVIIVADAGAAAVAVALSFAGSYWMLVALGAGMGCARLFSEPAFAALAPRLAPDDELLRANALIGAANQSAIAFGPLLAAGAIAGWGLRSAFLVDAVTYVIGILTILPLRLRAIDAPRHRAGFREELRSGFDIVRDRPALARLLAIGASVYLVWGAYGVIEPIYFRDVLHEPPSTFAWMQAVFGFMLLGTALLLPRLGERIATLRTVQAAAIVTALVAPIYVGTQYLWVAAIGIGVWGAATAWFVAPHRTLVHREAPIAAHGRVLALDSALRSWAHVIGLPLAALGVTVLGVRGAAISIGAIALAGALVARPRPVAQQPPREDAGLVPVVPAEG
jgi:predicted MFS family arabinose efflux permease